MTYVQPLVLIFSLAALSGLLLWKKTGRSWLCVIGTVGFFAISWPPVDWLLSRHLEVPYPMQPVDLSRVRAIVVLSAGMIAPLPTRPYPLPDEETYRRCDYAAWLYREEPRQVLACGGGGYLGTSMSAMMRDLLMKFGVPADSIWIEEKSTSTYENALFGAAVLKGKGIGRVALVVDQRSMKRAEACFRKQGIDVLPAPAFDTQLEFGDVWMPSASVISRNELTLHETLGFVWYWVRGWI